MLFFTLRQEGLPARCCIRPQMPLSHIFFTLSHIFFTDFHQTSSSSPLGSIISSFIINNRGPLWKYQNHQQQQQQPLTPTSLPKTLTCVTIETWSPSTLLQAPLPSPSFFLPASFHETHTHTYTCIHKYVHTYTHTSQHAYIHHNTHACTHTNITTHTHTHLTTHACTHTHRERESAFTTTHLHWTLWPW